MRTRWRQIVLRWRILLAVIPLVVMTAGTAPVAIASQQDGHPFEIGATLCERTPATLSPSALAEAGCEPAPGVAIEVHNEGGEILGGCLTSPAVDTARIATCVIPLPFDTAVTAYEDESTLPPGYLPLEQGLFERTPPPGVVGYPPQFFINVPSTQELPTSSPAAEPEPGFSITLRGFTCEPGVTAADLPAGCTPAAEGFSVIVTSLEGVAEPLELADATRTDGAYVWDDEIIRRRGMFGRLGVRVMELPPGYTDYAILGDQIAFDSEADRYVLRLPPDAPRADVAIYALAPLETPAPGATADSSADRLEIAVRPGSCGVFEPETVVVPLVDVSPLPLETVGQAAAPSVQAWLATVPISLTALQVDAQSIEVRLAQGSAEPGLIGGEPIACGEMTGALSAPGAVTVAMRESSAVETTGIAYLSQDATDAAQTDIVVFLVGHANRSP
jgi:hypothetical protein